MKQIIMTDENEFILATWSVAHSGFESDSRVKLFWKWHLQEHGDTRYTVGLNELFLGTPYGVNTTSAEWAKRTYEVISLSTRGGRESVSRQLNTGKWYIGSNPTKSHMLLNHAREFKYMGAVFVKWGKKFYAIQSGDAEALVLGYMSFGEIEKKEVNYKPYKYLKL